MRATVCGLVLISLVALVRADEPKSDDSETVTISRDTLVQLLADYLQARKERDAAVKEQKTCLDAHST